MSMESKAHEQRTQYLCAAFRERYGGEAPVIVRAPGRVNLIGEHTDYNDGYVLPIAIEHDIRIAVRRRPDRTVRLYSLNFDRETLFDLDDIQREEGDSWGNYVRGMAVELMRDGRRLYGFDGVMEGNIPIGAGLSSSAATEIAVGLAFLAESSEVVEPRELALIAQRAETNYVGVRVGIMDQFASVMGHAGHALFLDCRSLEYDLIPIETDEYVFVVSNSMQGRELAGSAYNERRAQCEAAVAVLRQWLPHVKALRDVSREELARFENVLDPVIYRRARHVVTENERVLQAVEALRSGDLTRFGRLMDKSHESLRLDYEVSSPALDSLVNAARSVEGCLGSRLTGAGFGGSTVSLVRVDRIDAFTQQVGRRYLQESGEQAEFYVTRPAAGAGPLIEVTHIAA